MAGSAVRRRQRMLRSMWRHEQMAIKLALAEKLHHSACRPVLSKEELVEHAQYNAPRGQKTARAVGGRPAPLSEVAGWQERIQRHAVEHLDELAPLVQILDAPVPQMVDNVMYTFRLLDRPIAEQVIEVPKISCSPCPSRMPILVPRMAEQLVEVPTVLSPALLQQQTVEQPLHIPAPRDHGVRRLQGSLPGQNSTASGAEQIAVTPVPGRGISGGLQGFAPRSGFSSVCWRFVAADCRADF